MHNHDESHHNAKCKVSSILQPSTTQRPQNRKQRRVFEHMFEILGAFFNQYNYQILPEKSMYNSVLFSQAQNPMYFYAYCPYYTYTTPYICTQIPVPTGLNQNSRNSDKKHEIPTSNNMENPPRGETQRQHNVATAGVVRPNKRRHYRNKSKLIESAKKNCESNIINHILAFLTKNKQSQAILEKAIGRLEKPSSLKQSIKQVFYETLKLINLKRERKYINRKTILCLFRGDSLLRELPFLEEKLQQYNGVTLEELCYLYRVCIFYYIRNQSQTAILTSKRIEAIAKKIHLRRRSFILQQIEA